jgi:cation:H+ antiporter
MFQVLLLLIAGFALLIVGADMFVGGASDMARRLHISPTIIGLTIVALGTSLPEASVSIAASLAQSNALAISNIIGSNIFNTLVVVGVSALITPFLIPKEVIKRDLPFNIVCTIVLAAFCFTGTLQRWMGVILLLMLAGYIYKLVLDARKQREENKEEQEDPMPVWKMIVYLIAGAAMIWAGGELTVNNAKELAAMLGMSEGLIGLTIVALGTSLPELATSVVAAKKGESGLSIGNAIGSNIMNILFILGASSALTPLAVTWVSMQDVIILLAVAIMMYLIGKFSPKLGRSAAALMLAVYIFYLAFILMRAA